jgi:hypothetical protein
MRTLLFMFLLAVAFTGAAQAGDCKATDAVYAIPDTPGFELRLGKATELNAYSDLEAVLTTPTRKMTFSFTASNGYAMNYLVLNGESESAESEETSFRIYGFNKSLDSTELPNASSSPPDYLFVPELGLHLHYGTSEREFIPVAMWRLQPCE